MANRLSYNDLLKYMGIVLDMEKNVYIEQQTLNKLQNQADCLGIARNYKKPDEVEDVLNIATIFAIFFLSIVLGVIVYAALRIGSCILTLTMYTLQPAVCLRFSGIVTVLSIIILIGIAVREQLTRKREYRDRLNEYNEKVFNDSVRVQNELPKKQYILSQCNTLSQMLTNSRSKLRNIYSCDILAPKYRNIIAVSSIYEYLKNGRTKGLEMNGSDEGAYNKFESELRLNKIITNTDIIIQKLDVVIENQRELANTMRNAQNSINHLITSTNNMSAQLQSGINNLNASVELSNYQQRQTNNELHYMNLMNTLHFYK